MSQPRDWRYWLRVVGAWARRALAFILILAFTFLLIPGTYYGVTWAFSEATTDRRLTALDVIAGWEAVLLAAFAGLIALLAYSNSIRRPRLDLLVRVGDATENFEVGTVQEAGIRVVAQHPGSRLNLILVSRNHVSARNPAVRVLVLGGVNAFQALAENEDWRLSMAGPGQPESAQWDGGANYLVHGGWSRVLPPLQLGGLRHIPQEPHTAKLQIQWVADDLGEQSRLINISLLV
jgi:hypothetical protein